MFGLVVGLGMGIVFGCLLTTWWYESLDEVKRG